MSAIQKKICMLGAYSVGKTSLISQYVNSIFSEKYTTTIGVKIDKKQLLVDGVNLSMILWDVYGEDNHQSVMPSYLRGLSGYVVVVDPTRPSTVTSAVSLQNMVDTSVGSMPFVLALNKCDLKEDWVDSLGELDALKEKAFSTFETSAKLDVGVDELFESLGMAVIPAASNS